MTDKKLKDGMYDLLGQSNKIIGVVHTALKGTEMTQPAIYLAFAMMDRSHSKESPKVYKGVLKLMEYLESREWTGKE